MLVECRLKTAFKKKIQPLELQEQKTAAELKGN